MAKHDPTRSLRAKLAHAERSAKAAREVSSALTSQLAELREKLGEAERERDWNARLYKSASENRAEAEKLEKSARSEIERINQDLFFAKSTLRGVEGERDQARAHADAMRDRAFPARPEFPWEKKKEPAGPYDPMTGQWRGS